MKGKQGLIIAAVIIVILAGLGYFYFGKSASLPGTKSTVFTSVQDALSKSLSLKCEYTDTTNGTKTTAYIKNGAVRADTTSANANESGSVIMKDKKMYFWNAQGGFMMEVPDVTPEPGTPTPKGNQAEDIMKDLEKYKESCKPAVVADSLFTPPSDVTFTDFSKMMQVPTGNAGQQSQPTIDQKQVEELMKQYSNPPAQE